MSRQPFEGVDSYDFGPNHRPLGHGGAHNRARCSTPIMMAVTCRVTIVSFVYCVENVYLYDETKRQGVTGRIK